MTLIGEDEGTKEGRAEGMSLSLRGGVRPLRDVRREGRVGIGKSIVGSGM